MTALIFLLGGGMGVVIGFFIAALLASSAREDECHRCLEYGRQDFEDVSYGGTEEE